MDDMKLKRAEMKLEEIRQIPQYADLGVEETPIVVKFGTNLSISYYKCLHTDPENMTLRLCFENCRNLQCPVYKIYNERIQTNTTWAEIYALIPPFAKVNATVVKRTGTLCLRYAQFTFFVNDRLHHPWPFFFTGVPSLTKRAIDKAMIKFEIDKRMKFEIDKLVDTLMDKLTVDMKHTTVDIHDNKGETKSMKLIDACTELEINVKQHVANTLQKQINPPPPPLPPSNLQSTIDQVNQTVARITLWTNTASRSSSPTFTRGRPLPRRLGDC
jgi:hypothetical protein